MEALRRFRAAWSTVCPPAKNPLATAGSPTSHSLLWRSWTLDSKAAVALKTVAKPPGNERKFGNRLWQGAQESIMDVEAVHICRAV